MTIIEAGAGENVPTIRRISEDMLTRHLRSDAKTTLIRINPHDQETRMVNKHDVNTHFLDEHSTEDCFTKAVAENKARSVIKIRTSTKDAVDNILRQLLRS